MRRLFFILAFLLLLPQAGWGATYYADGDDGVNDGDCGNGTGSDACATISYLTETRGLAQNSGDIISIGAGAMTDNNQVVLELGVDITGAGKASVTISSNYGGYYISAVSGSYATGNHEISGFTLSGGPDADNRALDGGILVQDRHNVEIHDVDFQFIEVPAAGGFHGAINIDNTGAGTSSPPGTYLTDISIHDCSFTACSKGIAGGARGAIGINGTDGATIYDNTIDESAAKGSCIECMAGSGGWMKSGSIYNNTMTVADSTVTRDEHMIIELWYMTDDTAIYGNTFNHGYHSFVGGDKGSGTWGMKFYNNLLNNNSIVEVSMEDAYLYNNFFNGVHKEDYTHGKKICLWFTPPTNITDVIDNIVIQGNVFWDYDAIAIYITDANCDGTCSVTNVKVYNNTFDGNNTLVWPYYCIYGTVSNANTTATGWEIKNNIIMNISAGSGKGVITGGDQEDNITSLNCTYTSFYNIGGSDVDVAGSTTPVVSDNLTSDPKITASGNKPGPYYTLQSDSPCIDAGTDTGYNNGLHFSSSWVDNVVLADQDDFGSAYEIGAFIHPGVLTPFAFGKNPLEVVK